MKEKKIGIITHYYKSINYGGNYQAYALCEFLNKNGYFAEQICYDFSKESTSSKSRIKKLFSNGIIGFFKYGFYCFGKLAKVPFIYRKRKSFIKRDGRKSAFENFNSNIIPHGDKVYNANNIAECVDCYDAFITGSDQVWNIDMSFSSAFFLTFIPPEKTKTSYAASISMPSFTQSQRKFVKESLKDYKAVSLREKSSTDLIKDLSPVDPVTVLDPTLLLTAEEWDGICADRVIDEDYVFCYFLGRNKKLRKVASQYAKKHGKKLVCVPMEYIDAFYGEQTLYGVSPEKFLSLIKYADRIFTDSFHAVVFSNIYRKQYYVFNRNKKGDMNVRIFDLTSLFNQENRFCYGKEREALSYVESIEDFDYSEKNEKFEELKNFSENFLKKSLEEVK